LPSFITYTAASKKFDFAPTENSEAGDYDIKVVATDNDFHSSGGVLSCEDTFTLTVAVKNSAPSFSGTHSAWSCTVRTDSTYSLLGVTDPEAGDTLSRSLTMADGSTIPSFVTYGVSLVCSTSDNNDAGSYSLKETVTDDNSLGATNGVLSSSGTFTLTVLAFNIAPTCTVRADIVKDTHSGSTSYTFLFDDIDKPDDTRSVTLKQSSGSALPSFITFDSFDQS